MTLEVLISKYNETKDVLTEREKAVLEKDIWEAYLATNDRPSVVAGARGHPREDYLHKVTGVSVYDAKNRGALINAGKVSEPLWEKIEKKKLLSGTAVQIMRDAKRLMVTESIGAEEAIARAFELYESRPYMRVVDGVPVRMGRPQKGKGKKTAAPRGTIKPGKSSEGMLWAKIRQEVLGYFASRSPNLDPIVAEQLTSELTVGLKVLLEEFRNKLRAIVSENDEAVRAELAVSRRDVTEACHTLHMDPPREGKMVDLDVAARQKKKLARLYHPDAHGGDESMRPKMAAVLAAYLKLEQYNLKLKPTGKEQVINGSSSEDGGHRA